MSRKPAAAPLKAPLKVLWVDDDLDLTRGLADYLHGEGYAVDCASDLGEATRKLSASAYDLALVDLDLPDGSGFSLVRDAPRSQVREFVVVTGQGSVRNAVEAVRHQVFDYLLKPVELAELCNLLARVAHARSGTTTSAAPRGRARKSAAVPAAPAEDATQMLVGGSAAMDQVRQLVRHAAGSDITVLVQGESGTGKEVVANCLHLLSHRAAAPFVAFNCAAVSPTLIASELFGHEKGSFTGAMRTRPGIFERAAGGTLFLDEVTEMPLELQASLLRVLETGTVVRVGGDSELPVDVRIVAATNREPMQQVEQGRLRLDLYYRLQVFPIILTPLRQRPEDILLLAGHFLAQLGGGKPRRFSDGAIAALQQHSWPGNARELRNVIERACLLGGELIEPAHLLLLEPPQAASSAAVPTAAAPDQAASAGSLLRDAEQDIILRTLADCGGNKTRAAARLGISLKTLYNKLKRFERGQAAPQGPAP